MSKFELLELAQEAVKQAAELIPQTWVSDFNVKSDPNDIVTEFDKRIEDDIVRRLRPSGYEVLGEESHRPEEYKSPVWLLDPIDGTLNFVETHRDYAISLALCQDGIPSLGVLLDVVNGRCYTAMRGHGVKLNGEPVSVPPRNDCLERAVILTDFKELEALPRLKQLVRESRGHRRYGSAAIEILEVALGNAGAFVHLYVHPWDIGAAMLIGHELGCEVSRIDGAPLDVRYPGSIVVAPVKTHDKLVNRLVISAQ